MPPVGLDIDLLLGEGGDHRQPRGGELLAVLPQSLGHQLGHPQPLRVHCQGPRGGLAGLHQILGELLEPLALPVQHLDILPGFLPLDVLLFEKVHIVDDGGEGSLQVMGDIGNKFSLHPLRLQTLVHGGVDGAA